MAQYSASASKSKLEGPRTADPLSGAVLRPGWREIWVGIWAETMRAHTNIIGVEIDQCCASNLQNYIIINLCWLSLLSLVLYYTSRRNIIQVVRRLLALKNSKQTLSRGWKKPVRKLLNAGKCRT